MSEELIERFRAAIAAYERGDIEPILAQLDEDFVVNDEAIIEDSTGSRGPEALRKNLERIAEAFPEVSYRLVDYVDLGDRMLLRVAFTGHAAAMDIDVNADVGQLWTMRGDKAVRLDVYRSWAEARRAAGLED